MKLIPISNWYWNRIPGANFANLISSDSIGRELIFPLLHWMENKLDRLNGRECGVEGNHKGLASQMRDRQRVPIKRIVESETPKKCLFFFNDTPHHTPPHEGAGFLLPEKVRNFVRFVWLWETGRNSIRIHRVVRPFVSMIFDVFYTFEETKKIGVTFFFQVVQPDFSPVDGLFNLLAPFWRETHSINQFKANKQ